MSFSTGAQKFEVKPPYTATCCLSRVFCACAASVAAFAAVAAAETGDYCTLRVVHDGTR